MEHLYLPPSLRYFVPLRLEKGSPGAHACLEYDLVEATRPELLVDLGAGDALSFSVFCQSMKEHDIDGLAYAVDVWESDAEREAQAASTWTTINNFLHSHFRGNAYLLKQSPEQALFHFADGSIDLLRIDLGRAAQPLSALLDAWSGKLKPGGILLCAGMDEDAPTLEAWAARMPRSVMFASGTGLGVAIPEPRQSKHDLLSWICTEDSAERRRLVAFYEHAARHHGLRLEILDRGDVLYRKKSPGTSR